MVPPVQGAEGVKTRHRGHRDVPIENLRAVRAAMPCVRKITRDEGSGGNDLTLSIAPHRVYYLKHGAFCRTCCRFAGRRVTAALAAHVEVEL